MNIWQRPDFIELCVNAEIGAYVEDAVEDREAPLLARRDASQDGGEPELSPSLTLNRVA